MCKFIELLPPTKSSPHNGITWQPSAEVRNAGLLTIDTKRFRVSYLVLELAASYPMRNFLFAKTEATPGSDAEESSYTVSVGVAGSPCACTCRGFIYGHGKNCKHIESVIAIQDNGWMDRDHANPDQDTANTEPPF